MATENTIPTENTMATENAMPTESKKNESTAMYTAGLVCGIVGVVFSFVPGISWIGLILGVIALTFGIIGLVKKQGGGKSIAATVLGGVSVLFSIAVMIVVATVINGAFNAVLNGTSEAATSLINSVASEIDENTPDSNDSSNALGEFLENYESDALGKTLEVTIEGYQDIDDFWSDKGLVVTLKNISNETLSFTVNIEALDSNGNRIDESFVSADSLAPGQSITDNAFTLSSLDEDILEHATFRVYRATSY